MPVNILEQLNSHFGDAVIEKLSNFVGIDSATVKRALGVALPAVLGGVASKGATSQGASEILDTITKGGFGADTLNNLPQAFSGGESTQNLLRTGTGLFEKIFGAKTEGVIDGVSNSSGITKGAASSLLGLVTPVVMGVLGKEAIGSRLNADGLRGLLSGQLGFLKNALPAGLAGILGLTGGAHIASQGTKPYPQKKESFPKWLLALLALLGAGILIYLLSGKGCNAPQVNAPQVTAPAVTAPTAPTVNVPENKLGAFATTKLPNGTELNIPEFGIEKKLIGFIADPNKPVDETTWFSFDRLEFETNSATLKPSSAEQLKNIAEILKAYPKVNLKLGGYTDNTGNPESNLKLSQQRAETTMQELVKLGIDPKRLEAQGFGEQHPIADNATEEGKQKNRRIDLRVTSK